MIIELFRSISDTAILHSINPNIFISLYLLTFIPCWLVVYLIIKEILKRKTSLVLTYALIEILLLLLPYLYLMIVAQEASIYFYIIMIIISLFTVFSTGVGIINKIRTKKKRQ